MARDERHSSPIDQLRAFPADLAGVTVLTALAAASTVVPLVSDSVLRAVFALFLVAFLPGYAFVAALFPEHGGDSDGEGIDLVERLALSIGLSIALVGFVGLTIGVSPLRLTLTPILLGLCGLTLVCVAIAAERRRALPPEERFSLPWKAWVATVRSVLFEPEDRTDVFLNVALVLALLFALGAIGFGLVSPQQGERFTEFYLLTETDDGEYVAEGYPQEFVAGEGQSLVVAIENHEHETVEYTVVVQLERVEDDRSTVTEREELDRFSTTLANGESERTDHEVAPTTTGEDLRLVYLLYTDEPPEEPTRENAYRDLHVWIEVE